MLRALLCLCLFACAPRLTPGFEVEGGDFLDSNAFTLEGEDGTRTTQIQATSKDDWIYFDFETETEVLADNPAWDVGFQRFKIKLNEPAAVATLKDAAFDSLTEAPADGFEQDLPKSPEPDYAFLRNDGWYFYNLNNHTLTTRAYTYVLRSTEGALFKLSFVNYYDSTGSSGYPAFKWQKF
jgi:hypothetical protein